MTDYIIINGMDTRTLGVFCTSLPPVQIASERVDNITVPGRSGYLHIKDDSYDPQNKRCGFFYEGTAPEDAAKFIMTAQTVVFSNEPDKIYDCIYTGSTDLENTIFNWHEFSVNLECNPEKRLLSPVDTVTTVSPISLENPGNRKAYPTFIIDGTGTIVLTVGAQTVTLTDVVDSITVNGLTMQCYDNAGQTSNKMSGDFPAIEALETVPLSCSGTFTQIRIKPNWRWV